MRESEQGTAEVEWVGSQQGLDKVKEAGGLEGATRA